MRGKEGNVIMDKYSLRQFQYDVGDGKERVKNGPKLRKYTFESLSLFRSGMSIISSLTKKLYEDALKLFDAALPKIADENLKKKVKDIRDYAQEEKEFVDDECE